MTSCSKSSLALRLAVYGLRLRRLELEERTLPGAPFDPRISAELDDLLQRERLLLDELHRIAFESLGVA